MPEPLHYKIPICNRLQLDAFATGGCQRLTFEFKVFSSQHPQDVLVLDRRGTSNTWGFILVLKTGYHLSMAPQPPKAFLLLKILTLLVAEFAVAEVFDLILDRGALEKAVAEKIQLVLPLIEEYEKA